MDETFVIQSFIYEGYIKVLAVCDQNLAFIQPSGLRKSTRIGSFGHDPGLGTRGL